MVNQIINKDCLEGLKELEAESIDCCVTSPPYFGLRDYGIQGQFGLEETPELYVAKMVEVFSEVKRVLKKEGTLWLNLGDSYAASGRGGGGGSLQDGDFGKKVTKSNNRRKPPVGLKPKDLIGIPWMVAFALRSAGWFLRQDIIWHKPNCMPESVTDRCTKNHEYIFMLSKNKKYYYDQDAIKTPIKDSSVQRLMQDIENQEGSSRIPGKTNGTMKAVIKKQDGHGRRHAGFNKRYFDPEHRGGGDKKFDGRSGNFDNEGNLIGGGYANKRSVWTVTTKPFKEAHFATFPPDLIEPCVLAGCPENGIVLDPFMGAGTTAVVALRHNRNYVGFELNSEYIEIAEKRILKEIGF